MTEDTMTQKWRDAAANLHLEVIDWAGKHQTLSEEFSLLKAERDSFAVENSLLQQERQGLINLVFEARNLAERLYCATSKVSPADKDTLREWRREK